MAVADALRGVLPGERPGWARVLEALVAVLAVGLACSITLSEVTLLVMAAVLLARARGATWRAAPLAGPLLAFAGWTLLTAALSAQPAGSLRTARSLLVLGALWVVYAALPDTRAARRFATTVFVSVAVVAFLSIVQVAGCPPDGGHGVRPQVPVVGTYFRKCERAHGFFSIYMTLAGVLAVVLALTLPRLRGFTRSGLATFAWLAGAVALALTLVRGAWLGFAVGAGVTLLFVRRRAAAFLLLLALLLLVLSIPEVNQRLRTIGDTSDKTARERLSMLLGGFRMIRDHPIIGIGPGQVKELYAAYAPPEALRLHTSHLHNTPLQIAVERGVAGLALWLWIFVAFFVRALGVLRRVPGEAVADRALVVGALAAVAAFLVSGLFEYNFGDTEVLLVALSAMALPFVVERDLARRAA